ncbi:sulfate/molybdate ABC transporter ATP-binding protein [Alkanindiges illinoisensis]|uniref:sulfate/molybdate ABC transporter ATP-binding protein n=1 Tax=Alkanindiges illinoisensis TaxID=197183 RepID=UPI00047B8F87|nr:sulfate ABC transporter ATP-binding protein [Alkanindiges illinoisensis]
MSIQVKNIDKHFGNFHALNNISLDFPEGELVALLGPSGCGKTTLLRIIAGLESADGGQILLEGEDATDTHVRHRQVGFVFQHYALFRHMTVFDNVAFGLRVRPRKTRPSEAEIKKRVSKLLDLVQLGFLADRFPAQLSGGQRQRIALARALAVEPRVLLLDEPFGALDAKVRKELRRWLRSLHDELHITSIFVTHDQEEALEVADQIVVMNKGNIEQIGSPREVYDHPATPFVFDFLGQANRLEGQRQGNRIVFSDDQLVLPQHYQSQLPKQSQERSQDNVIVFARPNELHIHTQAPVEPSLQAKVIRDVWLAGQIRVELQDRQGRLLEVALTPEQQLSLTLQPGQTVWVTASNLHLFDDYAA